MKYIKYPVKRGFNDKSGKDENWITDTLGNVLVHGFGDCCRIGGIQRKDIARVFVQLLNRHQPKIKVKEGD